MTNNNAETKLLAIIRRAYQDSPAKIAEAFDCIIDPRGEALGYVRSLAAAPSAPVVSGEEWQPIETAPKDGTMILAFNSRMDVMAVVGWTREPDDGLGGGWTDVGGRNAGNAIWINGNYFDFWRPLPAPPGQAPSAVSGEEELRKALREALSMIRAQRDSEFDSYATFKLPRKIPEDCVEEIGRIADLDALIAKIVAALSTDGGKG